MDSVKERLEVELLKTYYQTSRENLSSRLRLRDQAIYLLFLVSSIVFCASLLKSDGYSGRPLLIIPFVSMAAALSVNYQNEYIARIVHYLGNDIQEELIRRKVDLTEWSYARGHLDLHKNEWLGSDRAAAELYFLLTPAVMALILSFSDFQTQLTNLLALNRLNEIDHITLWGWIVGLIQIILIAVTNHKVNKFKADIYASLPGRN